MGLGRVLILFGTGFNFIWAGLIWRRGPLTGGQMSNLFIENQPFELFMAGGMDEPFRSRRWHK